MRVAGADRRIRALHEKCGTLAGWPTVRSAVSHPSSAACQDTSPGVRQGLAPCATDRPLAASKQEPQSKGGEFMSPCPLLRRAKALTARDGSQRSPRMTKNLRARARTGRNLWHDALATIPQDSTAPPTIISCVRSERPENGRFRWDPQVLWRARIDPGEFWKEERAAPCAANRCPSFREQRWPTFGERHGSKRVSDFV